MKHGGAGMVGRLSGMQKQAIDRLYDVLKLQYFTCNIRRALNLFCPVSPSARMPLRKPSETNHSHDTHMLPMSNEQQEDNPLVMDESGSCASNKEDSVKKRKRKTRRGSRGGVHAKNRRLSTDAVMGLQRYADGEVARTSSKITTISNTAVKYAPAAAIESKRSRVDGAGNKNGAKQLHRVGPVSDVRRPNSFTTVGNKLWKRVLTSARIGSKYCRGRRRHVVKEGMPSSRLDGSTIEMPETAAVNPSGHDGEFEDAYDVTMFSTQPDEDDSNGDLQDSMSYGRDKFPVFQIPSSHCHISDRRYLTQWSTQTQSALSGSGR